MNTENLPTADEIITTTLERVEEIAAAADIQCTIRHSELEGPRDHALLNAIHDLLDIGDVYGAGQAERVEAARTLLAEFSEKAQNYSAMYNELANGIHMAGIYLEIAAKPADCDFIGDLRSEVQGYAYVNWPDRFERPPASGAQAGFPQG